MSTRRRLLLVVGLAVIFVLLPLSAALAFTDVGPTTTYATAITDLSNRTIISGFDDGTFRPFDPVKRMQFAKIMARSLNLSTSVSDICPFVDVPSNLDPVDPLYPDHYIAVCALNHITEGTNVAKKLFSPNDQIKRAQVITMVVRALDSLHPGLLATPPADYQSTWGNFDPTHASNAAKAEFNGLLGGLPLSLLDPLGYMSRGEVAQVLYNMNTLLSPSPVTETFTGSGDDVVNITKAAGPALLYAQGGALDTNFIVEAFRTGDTIGDPLINVIGAYQGIRPLDFDGGQTMRLQVTATASWTIEVRPLSSMRSVDTPGTISGSGDEVLRVNGAAASAHIQGNAASNYFGVTSYSSSGSYQDLLVNTTDPYNGTVILFGPGIIEVQAQGLWSLSTAAAPTPPPASQTTFTGSGDDVVNINKAAGPAVIYVQGGAPDTNLIVESYTSASTSGHLLVDVLDSYQGIRPLDFDGSRTTRVQVNAVGPWTIEIRPLSSMRGVGTAGTIYGSGDEVFKVTGSATEAHIQGNAASRYFGVTSYSLSGVYQDLLVNTTDPYDGTVVMFGPDVIEVQATGPWSFAPQP
jgi:S-layer homology domain